MAVYPWQATVQDQDGNGVGSAQVTVRIGGSGGDLATIYSDAAETSKTNPFNATVDGFAQFWAKAGTYYIEGVSSAQTTDGWYVVLGGSDDQVTLTATVAAGEAVTADGALATEATAAEYLGLAQDAGVSGDIVNVQSTGNFTLGTWSWTPDEYVYLTNAGALTQTPPTGTHRRIGIATTSTVIALDAGPVVTEVGGAGAENAIPALSDAGLVDYTMIEKAATGGAGAEDLLVQANGSGEIDVSFLNAVIDTTQQFTASGAITAGDAVALSAAGTVASVVEVDGTGAITDSYNPTASTDTQQNNMVAAYSPIANAYCLVWTAGSTSGRVLDLQAVICTYNKSTDAYSFGARLTISTTDFFRAHSVAYDSNSDAFIVSGFCDATGGNVFLYALTYSGTTLTLADTQTAKSTFTGSGVTVAVACHDTDGTGLVVYGDTTNNSFARPFSFNGSTISLGTQVTIATGEGDSHALLYMSGINKYLYSALYTSGVNETVIRYITSDGSTATIGTAVQAITTGGAFPELAYDPTNQRAILTTTSYTWAKLYDVSGTSVPSLLDTETIGVTTADAQSFTGLSWDPDVSAFVLAGRRTSDNTHGVAFASVVSLLIQYDGSIFSDYVSSGAGTGATNQLTYNSVDKIHLVIMDSSSTSNTTRLAHVDAGVPTTNAASFIGFARESAADTETLNVDILGDINGSQTALVANTDYYIASAGTLATAATGYGKVGRALSTTEILVTKNTWV